MAPSPPQLLNGQRMRRLSGCTNQQPPQRGGAVPGPILGWVEMAVGLPEGPSYPGHSPSFFRYAAP